MGMNSTLGRCYCGAHSISGHKLALTVAYCHCIDCRRWTGAAVPAFAAFEQGSTVVSPKVDVVTHPSGVARQNCPQCGSPLTAKFPYLPDQVYIPLGVLDDIDAYAPTMHCFSDHRPTWLHLDDGLPEANNSGRDALNKARDV